MRHAEDITVITHPIKNCMRQGWSVIRKGEIFLKTTLMTGKSTQVVEAVGYGNFGKINH